MLLVTVTVRGNSIGAPKIACEDGTDLVPGHYFTSSTGSSPYEVDTSETLCPSLQVNCTYIPGNLYNSESEN